MNVVIAGRDESASLGPPLRAAAAARAERDRPITLHPRHSALSLRDAANEAEFSRRFIRLMSMRYSFALPLPAVRREGNPIRILLSRAKAFVQRRLMYQHPFLVAQQANINRMIMYASEFDDQSIRKELARLQERVAKLEQGRDS